MQRMLDEKDSRSAITENTRYVPAISEVCGNSAFS
jgi:hypothetical protein